MNNILGVIGVIMFLGGFIASIMPGNVIKSLNLVDYVSKGRIKYLGYIFGVIGIVLIIISRTE